MGEQGVESRHWYAPSCNPPCLVGVARSEEEEFLCVVGVAHSEEEGLPLVTYCEEGEEEVESCGIHAPCVHMGVCHRRPHAYFHCSSEMQVCPGQV